MVKIRKVNENLPEEENLPGEEDFRFIKECFLELSDNCSSFEVDVRESVDWPVDVTLEFSQSSLDKRKLKTGKYTYEHAIPDDEIFEYWGEIINVFSRLKSHGYKSFLKEYDIKGGMYIYITENIK